ncbi:MAG: 3-hydroxybutyryl-CoA dehydrogenase, partial [Treponema sp.]|nr:3-hydroxybutyryl-CoA dehydrogenase [Treponema sp.]
MKKIGVVGAGTMGQGIACAFASSGYEVTVCDIKIEWAKNGIEKIASSLDKLVQKEKMTSDKASSVKANLNAGVYNDLKDADVIVEAILETMDAKKSLFSELDNICKSETIFCTNTSSLSVTEIAKGINHSVIGMHFFNPADRMKLVEVISGLTTPPSVKEKIIELS